MTENPPRPPAAPKVRPRRPPRRQPPSPQAPTRTTDGEEVTHLVIGRVAAPIGLKGELKLLIDTDFPERFTTLKTVYLGDDLTPFSVERGRLQGRFAVLKLEGIDDRDAAEPFRRQTVQARFEDLGPLPEGLWYWHQLVGLDVVTPAGERLGTLSEILETGSNDVYVVKRDNGKEILVPAIEPVIREVDLDGKRMVIEPLAGMLE